MIFLYIQAPFAAFRTFTAGWYRPTAMFMTHSAAYGLLLNLAGIESRLREGDASHDGKTPASLTRFGLPACDIALGVPCAGDQGGESAFPLLQSVYQQLHNYPVGSTGKGRAEECHGNKYNITPVRREFVSGLKVIIAVRTNEDDFEAKITSGVNGQIESSRYGLPFLGDNAFLPDRIEHVQDLSTINWFEESDDSVRRVSCRSIRWYERLGTEVRKAQARATRLTIQIDRADLSKTRSALFAPATNHKTDESPPDAAWVTIESFTESKSVSPKKR